MNDWKTDKAASDLLLPNIKAILGQCLIGEPPVEEDQKRNTDLIVLRLAPVRVACRVRKFEYMSEYRDEFTIRTGRPSGAKTELAKIVEGWGDYLFYGFASECGQSLAAWFIGDLAVFRDWYSKQNNSEVPGTLHYNRDQSSAFRAFCVTELPDAFIVAWGERPVAMMGGKT